MNTTILVEAGLTEAEAIAYTFLVQNSPIAPPRLSELINESRTNTYKLLESLEELGLAQKDESDKKIKYWAKNPNALLQRVKDKQEEAELSAKKLQSSLPSLVNDFLKHNEQPGVRFFQGKEGIKQVYEDVLENCEEVLVIRSPQDNKFLPEDFYNEYQDRRARLGIKTQIITSKISTKQKDLLLGKSRTVISKEQYNAPVEYDIYGDKVAILSFDKEAVGMIIESPQIAKSMKQLFELLSKEPHESLNDSTDKNFHK